MINLWILPSTKPTFFHSACISFQSIFLYHIHKFLKLDFSIFFSPFFSLAMIIIHSHGYPGIDIHLTSL